MGNIISYLRWRGDLLWSEAPFNEVDNLILACLSYFDFDGIVSEKFSEFCLRERDYVLTNLGP